MNALPFPGPGFPPARPARLACLARLAGWVGLAAILLGSGCRRPPPSGYQGYLEGEYLHIGSPIAGTLVQRPVSRGATVQPGDLLFVLESQAEQAAVDEAERRLAQAAARLENLHKGRRPPEIAALEARVAQNRATLELATLELARREKLRREDVVSKAELDLAVAQRATAEANLAAAVADLETARLGGRDDEIKGAEAERDALQASVTRARWSLDQKTQRAPVEGRVQDTYHEPGEFVGPGLPVLSLLPPANVKVRFFVPEADLSRVGPGTEVAVYRDGAPAPLPARVSYVSTRPEFTPPVIYSQSTRAKLVFLVEAAFAAETARGLNPGQPVDVRIQAPSR